MHLVRHLIQIPFQKEREDFDILTVYEIICKVIHKMLVRMMIKIQNNQNINHKDMISNYEISLTLFTIVQNANFFVFSELDLVKVFR
jgi:hypothetical protein